MERKDVWKESMKTLVIERKERSRWKKWKVQGENNKMEARE